MNGLSGFRQNALMTFGLNVEARFSGRILETASNMLGHAITAKTAKIDKKLKMVDLQIKKAKLDKIAGVDASEPITAGEGMILDRTELLKIALEQINKTKQEKNDEDI